MNNNVSFINDFISFSYINIQFEIVTQLKSELQHFQLSPYKMFIYANEILAKLIFFDQDSENICNHRGTNKVSNTFLLLKLCLLFLAFRQFMLTILCKPLKSNYGIFITQKKQTFHINHPRK